METKQLIEYKYHSGVYSLVDLINLVSMDLITEQDFYDITRLKFYIMKEKEQDKDEDH